MVKKLIFFFLVLFFSHTTFASVHLFLGARSNFSGVSAARVGIDKWELGLYSSNTYAIDKIFNISKNFYANFGFGYNADNSPAIVGGAGFNVDFVLGLGLRGEIYTVTTAKGYLQGAGTLGISWNFQ